jgi:predicted regulator of Ras-like GTPase activity (Roadblock/LC7/MglB family)
VRGDLSDIDLRELIQICCQHTDDVRLWIRQGDTDARVYFSQAAIVHATSRKGTGKAALFEALSCSTGAFQLDKDVRPPERTIDQPWRSLLLEAAELIDQSRRLLGQGGLPAGQTPAAEPRSAAPGALAASLPDELLLRLKAVKGVEAALLCGPAGEVLAHQGEADPERLAAIAAFVAGVAVEVGRPLALGGLKRAVVEIGPERVLVAGFGSNLLGVRLGEHASVEQVCAQARAFLGEA